MTTELTIIRHDDMGEPPSCLEEYFAERTRAPRRTVRIAERRDNLIVLDFSDAPESAARAGIGRHMRPFCRTWVDAGMILLLIASAVGSVATLMHF